MLVLGRKEGQWTTIIHKKTGEKIQIRVYDIGEGKAQLAFSDDPRNFDVQRAERVKDAANT